MDVVVVGAGLGGLAAAGRDLGDLDVLRAYIDTLDPAVWLERARRTQKDFRRDELVVIAGALERLDLASALRSLFGRLTRGGHVKVELKDGKIAFDIKPASGGPVKETIEGEAV